LHKWIKAKASRVFGIDSSPGSFSLPRGGACVRYLNEKKKTIMPLPKVLFAEGDFTKPFAEQKSRYLQIMLGSEDATTPYLQEFRGLRSWDVMACQFAIHYACESEETFKIFIDNVKNHCKSVFFGTCLDGKSVYTLLAGKARYILRSSGRTFAQLEKKYSDDGEWKPEFGQAVDVTLESTEKPMTEFLVPFEKITEMFAAAGFELLESKPFQELYTSQSGISLDESQQEYSFLHRTFAFKRRIEEKVVEIEVPMIPVAPSVAPDSPDVAAPTAKKIVLKKKAVVEEPKEEIVFFFSKEPTNKEFSSFYDTTFKIDDVEYKSAEHAFQAIKAKTFGDDASFTKIVKSKSAQSAKSFGKKVEKFEDAVWDAKKDEVMKQILRAKFSQNPAIRKLLLDTGDKILAEANPRDTYWGIGTSSTTTIAKNPEKWKGQNKLGKFLIELRSELRAEDAADEEAAAEEEE
jgi:hypothetical protein